MCQERKKVQILGHSKNSKKFRLLEFFVRALIEIFSRSRPSCGYVSPTSVMNATSPTA